MISSKLRIVLSGLLLCCLTAQAQQFNSIPRTWKWVDNENVLFSYDGSYKDATFMINASSGERREGVFMPPSFAKCPLEISGAVNITFSPDSSMVAYTIDNDLYVSSIASGQAKRITFDGSELILNGYSSWVYYEEILGRSTNYKAFWWSPDSRKIGFYRFDNSLVPMFPIYSHKGQDGSLSRTRYPKAGEPNPEVRIGIADVQSGEITWADFDEKQDQYFGTPFWGADSKDIFISRMPRLQNTLDLYAVNAGDGSKKPIYHETYPTWLDWIEGMIFTSKGLYMAREFETGWQQIYFLSYDGKTLKKLTGGVNWRIDLLRVDERKGEVYFLSQRDADDKKALYKVDRGGRITSLTNPEYNTTKISFSPDGKYFAAQMSNYTTPDFIIVAKTSKGDSGAIVAADKKGPDYDASQFALPQRITIENDGHVLPGSITYPMGFDPSKQYPVHVSLYGGPNTPAVTDRWSHPSERNQWFARNGIIAVSVDVRDSGHNGRKGLDDIYRRLDEKEIEDFCAWGRFLQSLPYVKADKIGVEGFSFGGTMTTILLLDHSDIFHYGIAGGGVYDWRYYDTHYTERFMDTPQANPDGYRSTAAVNHVSNYPVTYDVVNDSTMLRITHGTGDDNVHFQNSLSLIYELQTQLKRFELMIYPDGMHGYGGKQGTHSWENDKQFWNKYLLDIK